MQVIRKKRNVKREDFSHVIVPKGAKLIPLTKGKYALVDEEDYEAVNQYNWYTQFTKVKDIFYAHKRHRESKTGFIPMHRFLLGISDSEIFVDHINHNGLDNRRANLRACSNQQNCQNRRPIDGTTSIYSGVSFDKARGRWVATINKNKKTVLIGTFGSEQEAAQCRDRFAKKHYGEFANLNIKP